jgi:hypothetical protein
MPEGMVMSLQLLGRIMARNETYVERVIEHLRPKFDVWMTAEEYLTRSALGFLACLCNLINSFRGDRSITDFIHAYLNDALRVILANQCLLMETEVAPFVAQILFLVPHEDVDELYQLIQVEMEQPFNSTIRSCLIFFKAKLYEKLDDEKRLVVISEMDALVSSLLETKNMEEFNSILIDAMIQILMIEDTAKVGESMTLVQLGYR